MPIRTEIARFDAEMRAWRHDLHAHPELGFEEERTSAFVASELKGFGMDDVFENFGGTGVVGVLHGHEQRAGNRDSSIGLRADMDALPIQEANQFEHRSRIPGKMHACGHDGHVTMLLGAAKYLAASRNFQGTVFFIFQPAEEGLGGAQRMIDAGLMERFPCESIFGMHNWPELPEGVFGIRSGPMMAAADTFSVTVTGQGGHGAMPHLTCDPVISAVNIVGALQAIVSRNVDPIESAVISVTQFHAGTADNVIPGEARFSGTIRSFNPQVREQLKRRIAEVSRAVAEAHRTTANVSFQSNMSATINDTEQAERAAEIARKLVGEERVRSDVAPSMGAEDFAEMLLQCPGAYVWLGQGRGPGTPMVHTPNYDFNDDILTLGASFWATLVETRLAAVAQ